MLTARTLTAEGAQELQHRMRSADVVELALVYSTAAEAMSMMLLDALSRGSIGEAWEVIDEYGHCVGAFGYHIAGAQIYSLWAPLSRRQSRQILKAMPQYVKMLIRRSRCPALCNIIHSGNKVALKWLEMSGCFKVNYATPIRVQDRHMLFFRTLTLAEMEY